MVTEVLTASRPGIIHWCGMNSDFGYREVQDARAEI